MMGHPVLKISGIAKVYETTEGPIEALRRTNLEIENGEFVSIVGPSGCGKTTLLKIIGGLIPASSGNITMRGEEVVSPRVDISFVFQSPVLLPWKSALENVLLPVRVRKRVSQEEEQHARDLLNLVGLKNFEDRYPAELSGGMQQRVSICRALVQNPSCLLLDEPFGALDALTREHMNVFFNGLWRKSGCTVVLVTHSIQEAVFLSNRVIVMSRRPGEVLDDVQIPFEAARYPDIIGHATFVEKASLIRKYFNDAALE
jgi:NitT/TauT family transport system ATP-binding protein